ncbi:sulfur carrier protein ThiS [Chlorobaculum sp. 24CR]|uniref:sulfur carrier protein ThiS n=1 Tax=Chlorobaculum sp. 24CR TaxID=2508878 RepID=UPI00100B37CC|nr:sulfur carrier protein ThiS [Chlorobaculum sp. 24CR]RXK88942.1 sulfur carrier protein ThiS [Chlorobaculum sp. 24CR]
MSTIHITLNGQKRELPSGSSVADLLKLESADSLKVAVVVNEQIVRPDDRASHLLQKSDQVEILVFAGGG